MTALRVLLITDESDDTDDLFANLEKETAPGFEFVRRPPDALVSNVNHPFDAVLIDVGVTSFPLCEVLTELRKILPGLPVVLLVNRPLSEEGMKLEQSGVAAGLIRSECNTDTLASSIRRAVENRAREAEDELRRRLIEIITHEIRNPLTVAKTILTLVRLKFDKHPEQVACDIAERVGIAEREIDAANSYLTEAFRVLHNVPRTKHNVGPIDLTEFVRTTVNTLDCGPQNIRVSAGSGKESIRIKGDPDLLMQAIGTVVRNALAYSPADSPVEVAIFREGNEARLTVEARGMDIPADHVEAVFNGFYRPAGRAAKRSEKIGIELFICRYIVERHGGKIWAAPACEGSLFSVTLPCTDP